MQPISSSHRRKPLCFTIILLFLIVITHDLAHGQHTRPLADSGYPATIWKPVPGPPSSGLGDVFYTSRDTLWGSPAARSTDGGDHWTTIQTPFPAGSACFSTTTTGIATYRDSYKSQYFLMRTTNSGATWKQSGFPILFPGGFRAISPAVMFGYGDRYLMRSSDTGSSWSVTTVASAWIRNLSFCDQTHGFLAGTSGFYGLESEGACLRSTDGGFNWEAVPKIFDHELTAVCAVSPKVVYAGDMYGTIYKSIDSGATWYIQKPSLGGVAEIWDIAFPSQTKGIAIGSNGTLFETLDSGHTWVEQTPFNTFGCTRVRFFNDSLGIIVGGNWSVLRSTNGGLAWVKQPAGNSSLAHTYVFPNPASDHIQIEYELKSSEPVGLSIYTEAGQLVKDIPTNGMEGVGKHSLSFDTNGLAPGSYLLGLVRAKNPNPEYVRFTIVR